MYSQRATRAIVLTDQAVFSATSFLVTIMLARLLSVEDFGLFAGMVLVVYLAVSLVNAFVVQPLQVMLPSIKRTYEYSAFTLVFHISAVFFIVGLVAFLLLLPLDFLKPYASFVLPAVAFSMGFLMQDYFRKRMLAENAPIKAFFTDFLLMISHLGGLSLFFYTNKTSLPIIVSLLALGYLPATLYAISVSIEGFSISKRWFVYLRWHRSQGIWLFYTAFIQWWAANLFVVASGFFLGAAALGALRLVQSVFGVLNILFQAFENYILPQTAGKISISKTQGIAFLKDISKKTMMIVLPALSLIFFFSDHVIVLIGGESYREYSFLVKGMALLYVLIFIAYPIRVAVRALVMNTVFFQGYVLTFLFGLASSWMLLPLFGLAGAIGGLIISQTILLLFWQFKLSQKNIYLWK